MQSLRLRFFDTEVEILSDSGAHLGLFAQMYPRFAAPSSVVGAPKPTRFILQTQPGQAWEKPTLNLDGEIWPIDDPQLLDSYFYDCILNAIITRVRSHFLIHAGVIAADEEGIILAGDAGHGKTTLVLELVRRGFQFLSDEMAALGRVDRQVHPFPRSLRIEPHTLELTGFSEAAARAPIWVGKLLLDIEEIQRDSLSQAVPIRYIIILQDPIQQGPVQIEGGTLRSEGRELGVILNRVDTLLLDAVRRIKGVTEVRSTVERGYPALRLQAAHRMSVLSRIEEICHQQRILILDISKRAERYPIFGASPQLEAIPHSQAVIELLRRFQGGHKSALLQDEFGGSATRLFAELAETISEANCYQLFVGHLDEMAELVSGLVGCGNQET